LNSRQSEIAPCVWYTFANLETVHGVVWYVFTKLARDSVI
jgi:hypothetical protein